MEDVKLKCVVVDDSGLQRLSMVKLIKDHPNLQLVGEFSNAIETKNGLLDLQGIDTDTDSCLYVDQ